MNTLRGKTLFISGASRGIGLAIALRAAEDGANHLRQEVSHDPSNGAQWTRPRPV